jgi:hypothetical protein
MSVNCVINNSTISQCWTVGVWVGLTVRGGVASIIKFLTLYIYIYTTRIRIPPPYLWGVLGCVTISPSPTPPTVELWNCGHPYFKSQKRINDLILHIKTGCFQLSLVTITKHIQIVELWDCGNYFSIV